MTGLLPTPEHCLLGSMCQTPSCAVGQSGGVQALLRTDKLTTNVRNGVAYIEGIVSPSGCFTAIEAIPGINSKDQIKLISRVDDLVRNFESLAAEESGN